MGLGNPGPGYRGTRHNAGYRVVEAFAERHSIPIDAARWSGRYGEGEALGRRVGLLLPGTFMNRSGESVEGALVDHPELDPARDLVVVYDDLDLPFGRVRLRPGGGTGGHRGVESIAGRLGRRDFVRLRFGIGRPPPGGDVVDYVLSPFGEDEQCELEAYVERAVLALTSLLEDGIVRAMDRFNREAVSETPE